jgi:uncharacterized protein
MKHGPIHEDAVVALAATVKQMQLGEATGHDWWHTHRVWTMAVRIGRKEKADLGIVSLGALLHDIADWKFHDGDLTSGPTKACGLLREHGFDDQTIISPVCEIVRDVGYKGGHSLPVRTIEGQVVQDADRLDAIGAIGIARCFAYSGATGRPIYDPTLSPRLDMSMEEYRTNKGSALNHFQEKLFRLKGLMNTATGRRLAEQRDEYMQQFVARFLREWSGQA